ncbi:hypothetical protein [Streptomyces sp. NPDC059262]|uniref:hypothetical protein n=1 Tax=Streptomyces sp. NPDC059262 TaxID=3346797 RepID=UPI0036AF080C
MTVRAAAWTTDPYTLSSGDRSLLTLFGAQHFLGGISGYEAAETTDESPAHVALVQHVTTVYLCHVLGLDSAAGRRPAPNSPRAPSRWALWSPRVRQGHCPDGGRHASSPFGSALWDTHPAHPRDSSHHLRPGSGSSPYAAAG